MDGEGSRTNMNLPAVCYAEGQEHGATDRLQLPEDSILDPLAADDKLWGVSGSEAEIQQPR